MTKPKRRMELIPCQACGQLIKKVGPRRWCSGCYDIETRRLKIVRYHMKKLANQQTGDAHGATRAIDDPKL